MKSRHLKGFMIKGVQTYVRQILLQRQSNLESSLKRKIDSIEKLVQLTRQKITGCWELILQEDSQELSSFLIIADNSIQKCKVNYLHLLNEYPNNRLGYSKVCPFF
jgi:hypothetical protein